MNPWFFDLLGVPAHGRGFELILWGLVALAGSTLGAREWRSRRAPASEWLTWVVAVGLVGFGLWRVVAVAQGSLYLGDAGLRLPTYGVAIASGFGLSIWMSYRDAERSPATVSGAQMVDLAFWTLVGGLVGARLLYFFTDPAYFVNLCVNPSAVPDSGGVSDCFALVRFWEGGIVFWGGFVGGIAGGAAWCRLNGASFFAAADIIIPYVSFGHAVGRLGCIGAGCCFGSECESPLGIQYPQGSLAWTAHFESGDAEQKAELLHSGLSHVVHAVQLYEAVGELAIFAFIAFWLRPRRRFAGELLVAWMVGYSALRIVTELFRGDSARGFIAELPIAGVNAALGLDPSTPTVLSTSQFVSLLVLVGAGAVWATLRRRAD